MRESGNSDSRKLARAILLRMSREGAAGGSANCAVIQLAAERALNGNAIQESIDVRDRNRGAFILQRVDSPGGFCKIDAVLICDASLRHVPCANSAEEDPELI